MESFIHPVPQYSQSLPQEILRLENVSKTFVLAVPWLERLLGNGQPQVVRAVTEVSLVLRRGETLALVGESGCGKSTVARLAVGLYSPTAGTASFLGVPTDALSQQRGVDGLRRKLQMIFQDPYASLNPRWRVARIIAEPLLEHHMLSGRAAVSDKVAELLQQVGLAAQDGARYPHQFSGGQRQRISIARALASQPECLICDEPTSALDVSVQAQVLNLMKDLQQRYQLSYLFISHNLAVVRHMADRVGVMYLGRIVELAPKNALFTQPRHPYTQALLAAVPDLADAEASNKKEKVIAGEVPSPIHPPSGCTFHPRCPWANARCQQELPILRRLSDDVQVACHAVEEGRISAF